MAGVQSGKRLFLPFRFLSYHNSAEKSSSQLIAYKGRDGVPHQSVPGGRYLNRQLGRDWPPGSVGAEDAS